MKSSLFYLLLCCTVSLFGQMAEPILPMTQVEKSPDFYRAQAKNWEKHIAQNPKDANAWYHYYAAARYTNIFSPNTLKPYDLVEIVERAKKAIPNTYESYFLQYWIDSKSAEGFALLKKAYELYPEREESYEGLIALYHLYRNEAKAKELALKYFHSSKQSPGLAAWNHNMLVNLDANAILFTNGDNDTYPAWILQYAKGFRSDVLVLNTSLLLMDDYRQRICQELQLAPFDKTLVDFAGRTDMQQALIEHFVAQSKRPVYLAISIDPELRGRMEDKLYLTGMSFRYSDTDYEHLPILRMYYEQQMLTDAFTEVALAPDPAESILSKANQNYFPVLIKLLKHYEELGDESRVFRLKNQIRQIATAGNVLGIVEKYIE